MKTKVTLNVIKHCAIILFVSLSLSDVEALDANTAGEFKPVDPNRIPQILTMISGQVHDNYDKIKTWQGEQDVIIDYTEEGPTAERTFKKYTDGIGEIPRIVRRRVECTTGFAVDIESDFLYASNYWGKPIQYTDLESGRDLGSKSAPDFKRSIVTPESYIHCRPNTMRDGVVMSRKAVKEALQECPTCDSPSVFDPRELFGLPLQPVWVTFPRMIKIINEHGEYNVDGYRLQVEERTQGNSKEYRIIKPGRLSHDPKYKSDPENYLFLTQIFSGEKGFNVVLEEMAHSDGGLLYRSTLDYDLIDGIYLPSKTTNQNFRRDSGNLAYEKKGIFKNLQVNHPIPEDTFSYKNLGLQNGDKFVDKIAEKTYIYKAGQLLPESEK